MKADMDPRIWHKVAAFSGIAALILGTHGAHIYRPQNVAFKEVWQRASANHLVHAAALVAAPLVKHPNLFGGLLTAGILAFSGTCYTVTYLEDRKYSFAAPYGGFAFIAALSRGWADSAETRRAAPKYPPVLGQPQVRFRLSRPARVTARATLLF